MFNSVVIDVVIGLVFIYLLYSLLATTVQEIIASHFAFRSKILERAVFRMLEDDNKFKSRFSSFFYLFKKTGNGGEHNSVTGGFYKHPLIRFLGDNKPDSKPAYITKETFSKVMVDLLRGDQVKPGDDVRSLIQKALDEKRISWGVARIGDETLNYIKSIWADSEGNIEKFKELLENWFAETMERASGWYKKHTQFILLLVGFVIAIVFNVDTIKIINKLEKDPKLREQIVQQADAFAKVHPDLDKQLLQQKAEHEKFMAQYTKEQLKSNDTLKNKILQDSLDLVQYRDIQARRDTLLQRADLIMKRDISNVNYALGIGWKSIVWNPFTLGGFLMSIVGWMITALALSLGAPFWFDLLNKFMKLRNSIVSKTSEEKQGK
jgi:hypothetical protein